MLDFILAAKADIQFVAMLVIVAAAWWWGASPERASASVIAAMFLIEWPFHAIFGEGVIYREVDVGHALIDLGAALGLIGIALFANRTYTLWLAALQLMSVMGHLVRDLHPEILRLAYAIIFMGPSYIELIVLAGGVALHVRRERRYGSYTSWRISSRHLRERGPNP